MQKYYEDEMIENQDKNASQKTTRLSELLANIQELTNGDTNGVHH